MTTADRARALADAAQGFPELGPLSADDLLGLVAAELGDAEILDGFRSHGTIRSRAVPPRCILHVVAGNTAAAALQSLIRGLLLGSENRVKLPSAGLPEVNRFVAALPADLAGKVAVSPELSAEWLREADAVIVFGSDETIEEFRRRLRPWQIFLPHGHRISFGIVFDDASRPETAALAARDVSLHDQQGCLSPHDLYVKGMAAHARRFAELLAGVMNDFNREHPRRLLTPEESGPILALRDSYSYRAANDPRVALWCSKDSTDWTVIFEEDPQFAVSPLNRVVFVKPLPDTADLAHETRLVRPWLSTVAIHPFDPVHLPALEILGASRICALGQAQFPSPFWHQDALPQLSPLVRWVDFG